MSKRAQQVSSDPLSTPLSLYLRATRDLPLPARFYDPLTLKPIIAQGVSQTSSLLIDLFEKTEGNLSIDDIAAFFILQNSSTAIGQLKKQQLTPLVETMRAFGTELSTRFGIERYSTYSISQLEADRSIWEGTFRAQKEFERLLLEKITSANSIIAEFPKSPLTKPEVIQSNLVFTRVSWNADNVDISLIKDRDTAIQPVVDKARLTNEDAADIFSLIEVTADIPYVGYHTPIADQYRVTATPPGSVDSSQAVHPDKDEYTYRVIINSGLYEDLRKSTSFISFMLRGIFGLLDISHSTLILNQVNKDAEDGLIELIAEVFPFLRTAGLTHRRITARILSPVGGGIAYPVLYFDAMYNQADYIGFKEEEDPMLLKPIKTLYLSPIPRTVNPLTDEYGFVREIKIVIANRTASNSELVTMDNTTGGSARGVEAFQLSRGTTYVEFMLYEISDMAMLKFATAYLSRMVGHYHEVAVVKYAPFIEEEFNLKISSESSADAVYARRSATSTIRGIDKISHSYPDVFGHNFTRLCPHYPTVKDQLQSGDVEYEPGDEGGGKNEWLKYPPDGAIEFYFRCGLEEPEFAQPGIITSKLRNKSKYPLLPCCFKSDQFKPGQRTEVAYRLGSAKASAVSSTDITVASWGPLNYPPIYNRRLLMAADKTLYRGRLGRIPEALMSIITSHVLPCGDAVQDEDSRLLARLGLSEPTMLHAAFLAVDPEYQKLSTGSVTQRQEYLKTHIKLPHPACLYQELSAEEASHETLMSNESFLHWITESHYRIIEETLQINLYVIIRVTPRENVIEPNHYFFEIPRTRSGAPHMRRHASTTRPSVILYRVRRFEAGGAVAESGLELLMQGTDNIPFSGIWGTSCSARIAELYTRSAQVLSFGTSPINPSQYISRVGLNTADYASALPSYPPISQLVDEKGLCRALTFRHEEHEFSIVFPGTQPYDLPFSGELKRIAYDPLCRKIFGDAGLTSMVRDGVFYADNTGSRYIFVPLTEGDVTLPEDMPICSYTPLTGLRPTAMGYATQWRTAYTYLRVILFVISFLYAFTDEPRDPGVFMNQYVTIDITRHAAQASEIYDFSGLKRVLILREASMREALATIKRLAPSLLDKNGEKIVVTSQKIFDGLAYFVRTVNDQTAATPSAQLKKKRWDLARVIAPLREGGGSATLLLSRISSNGGNATSPSVLNFGSARAVRTWFKGLRSGATSGSLAATSDSRAVTATVRTGTGVIVFRHPKTGRVWLIPGMTDSLRNITVVCYIWATRHRVAELEAQTAGKTAADRLAFASGAVSSPRRPSRITAMFRQTSSAEEGSTRRTRSRSRSKKINIGAADEDEDISDLSSLKHLLDEMASSGQDSKIQVNRYVITRDNRIELLREDAQEIVNDPTFTIEILRTGPNRYTPMLSP